MVPRTHNRALCPTQGAVCAALLQIQIQKMYATWTKDQSLDFIFNRFFMKLFKTSNMEIVNCCQRLFGCDLPSTLLKQRFEKFVTTL